MGKARQGMGTVDWGRAGAWSAALAVGGLLAACGGDDDVGTTDPVAVVDPCPAIPTPAGAVPGPSATGAYLCAARVGVSDLSRSVAFYQALGMREVGRLRRGDRDEVVLRSADATGSHLVLFNVPGTPAAAYRQNPGKIVFYAKDPTALAAAFVQAGGVLTSPPVPFQGTLVGFGRDPDNQLVEIAGSPRAMQSYLSAIGIGVSDLERARAHYVDVLDFKQALRLSVTRPDGAGGSVPWYDEYILVSPTGKGASVVLMHYTDGVARPYADRPVSLGLRVTDPAAYARRIAASGGTVVAPPAPASAPALGGLVEGTARDADGTLVHFHPAP